MPDGLVSFRFEVTAQRMVDVPRETYHRMVRFVVEGEPWEEGAVLHQRHDYQRDVIVMEGELPQPCVTALQALAMGHDLDAVLDLLESQSGSPVPVSS